MPFLNILQLDELPKFLFFLQSFLDYQVTIWSFQ